MMRNGLAFSIGYRYTRAKKRQRFVSFISLISVLGVALGVAVLITILSVFNGFDDQIKQQFFSMATEVSVYFPATSAHNVAALRTDVQRLPEVVGVAPIVQGQGMVTANGQMQAAYTFGIDPQQEAQVSELPTKITQGSLASLTAGSFHMVLGKGIADSLGVRLGDKVTLLTPQASVTPLGVMPRYKRFQVTGIFHASTGFGFDDTLAFISLHDAQVLYAGNQYQQGLRLKLSNPFAAIQVSHQLQQMLPPTYKVNNWTMSFGAFFKAIAMEKTMMMIILTLIIAVAAFNLVSSLMMTVNDKRAEIAILRTLGATPGLIKRSFLVQGLLIGMSGCLVGVLLGVLMSLNATAFVNWLQHVLHVQLISSDIYFVDYLPSDLAWTDVFKVVVITFALSLLATLYPAWSAGRTQPVEALRYEI